MQQIVAKMKIAPVCTNIYIAPKCYSNFAMSRDNIFLYTLWPALDWPCNISCV